MKKLLFALLIGLVACTNNDKKKHELYGAIYKNGYLNGINAARKCVKEKSREIKDGFVIDYSFASDTMLKIDSLKFIKLITQ